MVSGDTVTLTLKGGAPWGFRLQGGGQYPLTVSKIRKKSPAFSVGLQEGDTVISINGAPLSGLSHDEAMRYVDMSGDILAIEIFRGNMPAVHTVPGSYGHVINGHGSVVQDDSRVTSTTRADYDDGTTKGSVQTQSYVQKEDGRETRGFVQKQQMTSVVQQQNQWVPTQAPLPSLLDTSLSRQPYSSQPVQVQVSAMFGGPKEDGAPLGGYSTPSGPMFNVRKVTTTATTASSSALTTHHGDFQQNNQDLLLSPMVDEDKYPQFPLPEVKKWTPPSANQPKLPPAVAPKPKPHVQQIADPVQTMPPPIMRVRDIKTQMLSPRSYDDNEDVESVTSSHVESVMSSKSHHRLPVFAPPVQISLHAGEREDLSGRPHDLDIVRAMSVESEVSSPTSSHDHRKLFSDSAFYNDPEKNFPTIQDQMKLCMIIANSLTSAANRKARGAKMFAKRQQKSPKWVHDGSIVSHSVLGDIPGYYNNQPEVNLHFKIPSVKHRVTSPEAETKMSLSQAEFERMRLQSQRCEHQGVSPNLCFDIAQSLKNSKGKAGRLFEKRKQRAEKYTIDETNAKRSPVKPTPGFGGGSNRPLRGSLTPWEAALTDPSGHVEKAFDELSEFERKQKLNQMLKMRPFAPPAPVTSAPRPVSPPLVMPPNMQHSSLKSDPLHVIQGPNFNRKAKGWSGFNDVSPNYTPQISGASSPVPMSSQPYQQSYSQPAMPQFRNYNANPKAWRTSGEFEPQFMGSSSYASDSSNIMSPSGYHNPPGFGQSRDMPGTDL